MRKRSLAGKGEGRGKGEGFKGALNKLDSCICVVPWACLINTLHWRPRWM